MSGVATSGPRLRRHAGLVATLYLAGAVAAFVAAFAHPDADDYVGWIPVMVALQVIWCLIVGRPSARIAGDKRVALVALTYLLLLLPIGGAIAAVSDAGDAGDAGARGAIFGCVATLGLPYGILGHVNRKIRSASSAKASAVMLAWLTIASVLGGALAALSVASIDTSPAAPMFAGVAAWLGAIACGLVLVFTLPLWLWSAFLRMPSEIEIIPRATALRSSPERGVETNRTGLP